MRLLADRRTARDGNARSCGEWRGPVDEITYWSDQEADPDADDEDESDGDEDGDGAAWAAAATAAFDDHDVDEGWKEFD